MILTLTPLECKQLVIWADNTMAGGHWGDGNVVFPEEEITIQKVNAATDGKIKVSERDINTMIIWAENAVGKTLKGMTSEEISLISKLREAQRAFVENHDE